MLVRDLCEKALECARGKRLDQATRQYVFRHDEALDYAREALKQKYDHRDVVYFETQIDRFMDEVVEDPVRAVERRFLPDRQLENRIKDSLGKPPAESALLDMPERLLLEIKRKQGTLRRIGERRFHEGHIQTVAVPDGEGSYFADTVGTPGRWEVLFTTGDQDKTAAASATRLLDALCDMGFSDGIPQEFGQLESGFAGEDDQVVVVDSIAGADAYVDESSALYRVSNPAFSDDIAVERLKDGRLRLYAASRLLALSRAGLRGLLRDAFPSLERVSNGVCLGRGSAQPSPPLTGNELLGGRSCAEPLPTKSQNEEPRDETAPGVVMLDFSGTSGPYLVGHALEMKGIPTQIIKPGEGVALERPNIFCISLATQPLGLSGVGDQLRSLRETIDEHFPGSFIVLGGPSAKHAKTAITLYPEINILLRGEGEEVLPEVLRIVGRTRTTDGLSRKQITDLKRIDGLFLRTPGLIIFNNLHKVNAAQDFDVPVMFHYGRFSLFDGGGPIASRTIMNPDIARGCPFRCTFCSMAMGWNQRYVDFGKFQKYVLGMLAMEIPLPRGTEDAVAAALQADSPSTTETRDEWFPADAYAFSREQLAGVLHVLDRDLSEYLSGKGLIAKDAYLVAEGAVRELAQVFDTGFEDVKKTAESMQTGVLEALVRRLPDTLTRSQVNEFIVTARRRWMTVLMERGEDLYDHGLDHKLEIVLEDDNTLCNREYIETFCRWVIDNGLHNYLRFGGGQTSVSSFLKKGAPNEDFIRLLREAGCCEVEMGVDGLCNNTLKQNDKRGYRLGDAIGVIQMLTKWGINGASNRLYSAPYASRIDVVESLLLGALAPLGGHSLGGPFIITVPGSQYTNELAVNDPDRAANRITFEQTYGEEYEYAWARYPEYVPLEHHLYPYMPDASSITEKFASAIKIQREDKHIYDAERRMGKMTHELGILGKLETEDLGDEIREVVLRWQAMDQEDPELKALGEIIRIRRNDGMGDFSIFRGVLAETYSLEPPRSFADVLNSM